MNRRHFLATAASSIALASHAAEPARKWRVAIIGSKGGYGHSLDSMWLQVPGTEIVAAADSNAKTLAATQKKLNIPEGFADYHDIGKAKPDLVAIGPAMGTHRDMVLAAAEYCGRHHGWDGRKKRGNETRRVPHSFPPKTSICASLSVFSYTAPAPSTRPADP